MEEINNEIGLTAMLNQGSLSPHAESEPEKAAVESHQEAHLYA